MIQHFFPQSLSVGSGQQLVFRTQYGPMYQPNTNCTVNIKVSKLKNSNTHTQKNTLFSSSQRDSTCPSLVVSCPKFDIPHEDATCPLPQDEKVDYLSLGGQRFARALVLFSLGFQVLPELWPKQLHNDSSQTDGRIHLKQGRGRWRGRVYHRLLRFCSNSSKTKYLLCLPWPCPASGGDKIKL